MARRRHDNTKRCDHCGKGGLSWLRLSNGWRLIDTRGDVHKCHLKLTNPRGPLPPRVTDRDKAAILTATKEYEQYENSY